MNALSNLSHNSIYKPGDYIEFKNFTSFNVSTINKHTPCKGKIIDCTNPDLLEVALIGNENNNTIVWISPISITKHYPQSSVQNLSIRLLLKNIWKHFIFREVKTIKTTDPYLITYKYESMILK